jgi:L-amino acid N-acyltransferase YncA
LWIDIGISYPCDDSLRCKGIGRKIILALVQRGRDLGYDYLCVEEIYDWNEASKRCFESAGFRPDKKQRKVCPTGWHFESEGKL